MQLTNVTLYGIAILRELDKAREKDVVSSSDDLARALGMDINYVLKITRLLRLGGLIVTKRGPAGGIEIDRPAAKIGLLDLLAATDNGLIGDVEGDTALLTTTRETVRQRLGASLRGLSVADFF